MRNKDMNKRKIIGITGTIGSGKTTTSNILRKLGFEEYAFASPLKEIATVLKFSHDEIYGSQEQKLAVNKHWGISGREFLQKFGSEICRYTLPEKIPNMKLDGGLWIKLFQIEMETNPGTDYVISDVRFRNEAEAVRKHGGVIIRISRNNKNEDASQHISETEMSSIKPDFEINNNKSLQHLEKEVQRILTHIAF